MAGSVQAKIDVIIGGLREVAALEGRLESIQATINAINKDPVDLNLGGRGRSRDLSGKLSKNVNDLVRNFDNFGKSFSSVNKQATLFGDLMSQTALKSTGEFKRQDVAVKNLATAYTTATREAARFERQQVNLIRTSRGLQTSTQREIEVLRRRAKVSRLQEKKRRGQNLQQDLALGVGFPLLFGGGPGAVLGGAAGAIAGGGKGGFGLQVLGSAIGQQFDAFARAAAETGVALTSTAGALEFVREKSLFSSEQSRELAAQLEEQGDVAGLATLLTDELVKKVGNSGVAALTDLGDTTKETTTLWNQLTTQLQILISGPLNNFLKLVNDAIGGINEALKPTAREDFTAIRDRILKSGDAAAIAQVQAIEAGVRGTTKRNLRGGGTQTIQGTLTEAGAATGLEQLKAAGLLPKIPVTLEDKRTITPQTTDAERLAKRTQQQSTAAANRLALSEAELRIAKETSELSKIDLEFDLKRTRLQQRYAKLISKSLSDQERERLEKAQKLDLERLSVQRNEKISGHMRDQFQSAMQLNEELMEIIPQATVLNDEFKALANTINNEIVSGIEGVIDGTKTLGQVASSMLKTIANQMLQMAIMGQSGSGGIGGSLLSAIGGIFGFGGSGSVFTSPDVLTSGLDFSGAFANGGRPPVGKAALVGERGPELFVPRTTGTIVPNHAMGSATVNVAVDASGSSVEGNADQAAQLGKAIGVAVQQELIKQKRPGGLLAS